MLSPYFRRLSMNSFSRRFFGLIQLHASRDFRRHVVLSLILVQVGLHNSRVIGYCLVVRTCCHLFIGRQGESFMFRRSNFFYREVIKFRGVFCTRTLQRGFSAIAAHHIWRVPERGSRSAAAVFAMQRSSQIIWYSRDGTLIDSVFAKIKVHFWRPIFCVMLWKIFYLGILSKKCYPRYDFQFQHKSAHRFTYSEQASLFSIITEIILQNYYGFLQLVCDDCSKPISLSCLFWCSSQNIDRCYSFVAHILCGKADGTFGLLQIISRMFFCKDLSASFLANDFLHSCSSRKSLLIWTLFFVQYTRNET